MSLFSSMTRISLVIMYSPINIVKLCVFVKVQVRICTKTLRECCIECLFKKLFQPVDVEENEIVSLVDVRGSSTDNNANDQSNA